MRPIRHAGRSLLACLAFAMTLAQGASGAVGIPWQDARRMVKPKQVEMKTYLVRDGKPTAVIGVPHDAAYEKTASNLQAWVEEQTSVRVPVVEASTLVSGHALAFAPRVLRPATEGGRNLVLLGDLTSNPAIARLYIDYYAFENAAYPGKGGHTVRTVVDPMGLGWNTIVLGGSGSAEVQAAATEYQGLLKARDGGLFSEYCLSVTYGKGAFADEIQRRTSIAEQWTEGWEPYLLNPASDEYKAKHGAKSPVEYVFDVLGRHLLYGGLHYGISGERALAEAVGEGMDALYENLEWVEAHRKTSYDNHYLVEIWLRAWQQVADCPYLTDEQRERGHKVMAFLAGQMAMYRGMHAATTYRILSRHQYSGVFAGDALCRCVQRHCDLAPELADAIAENREKFRLVIDQMMKTYTTGFDHKWGLDGNWHLLQAAAEEPRHEYVTSGLARLNADFATMCINNAGTFVNFGAENIGAAEAYDAYQILGRAETLLRDGRYQWWLDNRMTRHPYKIFIMSVNWLGHWHHTALHARKPVHMIGLNRILVPAPLYEDLVAGKGRLYAGNPVVNDVPLAASFNKITFRDGLDADDQYLMLDGLGGTTYSGNDANAICEYSRFGQPLLVQYTLKHEPFYQNTVSVSRGNAGDPVGTFARLLDMTDLGRLAYTRSEVSPLSGSDNVRHLFMAKGHYFVLIDDVVLHDADEYFLTCNFRGFGEPHLDEATRTWVLRNEKADLFLQNLAVPGIEPAPQFADTVRVVAVTRAGKEVEVQMLRETAARQFAAGEKYRYANLFYGLRAGERPAYQAVAVGRDAIAVRGPETVLYGAPFAETARLGDMSIDASAFRLSRGSAEFISVRRISLGQRVLLDLRRPVTVEVDFGTRMCTWQSSGSRCIETIAWEPEWKVEATFRETLRGVELPTGETVKAAMTRLRGAIREVVDVAETAQAATPGPRPPGEFPLKVTDTQQLLGSQAPIREMALLDLDGDARSEIICAREDGHLVALGLDGSKIFDIATGESPLLSVWTGELNGEVRIICGARDGKVYAYDRRGELVWEYKNQHWGYGARPSVYSLAVGDFRGDGQQQLALGCHGGITLLDVAPQPEFVRFTEVYAHVIKPMSAVNIFGGQKQWLLLNSSGGGMKLVDPAGAVVVDGWARFWGGQACYQTMHHFEGNQLHFVHAGFNGVGCGRLMRELWEQGTLDRTRLWAEDAWYIRTDGETRAVLVQDFDDDGIPEILTGNQTGFLVCYDCRGSRLWKRLLGTPINGLMMADVTGDGVGELVVAGDSPGVTIFDTEWRILCQWSPESGAAIDGIWAEDGSLLVTTRDGEVLRIDF